MLSKTFGVYEVEGVIEANARTSLEVSAGAGEGKVKIGDVVIVKAFLEKQLQNQKGRCCLFLDFLREICYNRYNQCKGCRK